MDLLEQNQMQNMDGMCVPTGDRCASVVSLGVEIPLSEEPDRAFSLLKSKGGSMGFYRHGEVVP